MFMRGGGDPGIRLWNFVGSGGPKVYLKDLRLWIWTGLIDLKVVGGWVVGGPSNFIVNQSPNPWILGFEILDLDFGLDKISLIVTFDLLINLLIN